MDNLEVDKLLEIYDLPRLNHKETESPNRPMTSRDGINDQIFSTRKAQDWIVTQVNLPSI